MLTKPREITREEVPIIVVVTGRVADETGTAVPGVTVEARGDWLLTTKRLAATMTDGQGRFTLKVPSIIDVDHVPLPFRFRVLDVTKRPLTRNRELDGTVPSHDLGDVEVQRADLDGLLVTNLTGTAKFVSEGNAIKLLVDGIEAFGRITDDIRDAKHSVNITQLFFSLPPEFHSSPKDEKPQLIFKFLGPVVPHDPQKPASTQPPAVPRGKTNNTSDDRPERLLIDKARTDCTIRILLNEPSVSWPEGFFLIGLLTPLAAGFSVGSAAALLALTGIGIPAFIALQAFIGLTGYLFIKIKSKLDDNTSVDEARHYFDEAIVPTITVHGFRQALPNHGVMHCKMVITDEKRAVIAGSPFSQRYFDSPVHKIDDPQRGNTSGLVHDLSVAIVGLAVQDLYTSFRLCWNEDLHELEKLPKLPKRDERDEPELRRETSGKDSISKVQVVRTLSGKRFKELGGTSEKGILEGYLRAFAAAEKYIYLETQYFTDSVITEALVEVLKKKPNLELIIVVPIKPDVPLYPRRQACRIKQLREAGGERVGVFTRWTYDGNHNRPWVAPVYIHSKGAVIDDSWATIGSANLDGLSLDYNLLLSPLAFGETTATELNINVLPETPGAVNEFSKLMRCRLFAEHLGLVNDAGIPDPNHSALQQDAGYKWLQKLWRPAAKQALAHVKAAHRKPLHGFVLEYPAEDGGCLSTPRKHLSALGVHLKPYAQSVIRPIAETRKFNFSTGKWDKFPEREDIEQ